MGYVSLTILINSCNSPSLRVIPNREDCRIAGVGVPNSRPDPHVNGMTGGMAWSIH